MHRWTLFSPATAVSALPSGQRWHSPASPFWVVKPKWLQMMMMVVMMKEMGAPG